MTGGAGPRSRGIPGFLLFIDVAFAVIFLLLAAHRSTKPEVGRWSLPYATLLVVVALLVLAVNVVVLNPRTREASARVIRVAALSLGAVVVGFGLAELAVRLIPVEQAAIELPTGRPSESLYIDDHVLHHRFRPVADACFSGPEFDVAVRTNRAGFRDDERTIARHDGVCRIAVVGDSFVAGLEVEADQVWVRHLEMALGSARPNVEVLNFGVPAYSPALIELLVRDVVLAYQPDLILAGFCMNDVYEDRHMAERYRRDEIGRLVELGREQPRGFARLEQGLVSRLSRHSALFRLAQDRLFGWRYAHRLGYGLVPIFNPVYSAADEVAFTETLARFERISDLVHSAGGEMAVVALPYGNQVSATEWDEGRTYFGIPTNRRSSDHPQRFAQAWLDGRGIPMVDVLPGLRDAHDERLFFRFDTHPNREGHRLIAKELARFLREEGASLLAGCN